jgi:hypothetical protein
MWKRVFVICKSVYLEAFQGFILLAQFAALKYNSIKIF